MSKKIDTGFSFTSFLNERDVTIQQFCLERYKEFLPAAQQLSEEYPIFLDANVLLVYYLMPWRARRKLYAFLEQNKGRIYICDQVQREFFKHKESVAKNYESLLALNIPTERQRKTTSVIEDYLFVNDDVLEAYPDFKKGLDGLLLESEHIIKLLKDQVQTRLELCRQLLRQQDIATLLPQFQQLPSLETAEFEFLKTEFKQLRAEAEAFPKTNALTAIEAYLYKHPEKVFPGMCDIKTKPQTPYGDYFIFHEMMKWQAIHQPEKPIIFLTNDVTKSDWMDGEKEPYPHYLETMHRHSGNIFYVLHAESVFTKLLGVDCQHLILGNEIVEDLEAALAKERKVSKKDTLTPENLQNLLIELYPYREEVDEDEEYWLGLIEDLEHENGITSLFELKSFLLENYYALVRTELDRLTVYDRLDALLLVVSPES